MGDLGTRTSSRQPNGMPATRTLSRDFGQQDPGSLNQLSASLTFTASDGRITGANGTFAHFAVGDRFEVENASDGDGGYQVTGLDGTNQAFVTVVPPPKNAGPVTAFVRKVIS
jgi:hypothetical protein